MFMNKKLIWGTIGVFILSGSIATTLVFVLKKDASKENNASKIKELKQRKQTIGQIYKDTYYRPFQFQELAKLGKGQKIMVDGIGWNAYQYGTSFLLNILRHLGFDFSKNLAKTENGKIVGIKYYNGHNQKQIKQDSPSENPEKVFQVLDEINKNKEKHKNIWKNYLPFDPLGIDADVSGHRFSSLGFFWEKHLNWNSTTGKWLTNKYGYPIHCGMYSYWQMIDGLAKQVSDDDKNIKGSPLMMGVEVGNFDASRKSWIKKLRNPEQTDSNKKWSFNYNFRSWSKYRQNSVIVSKQKIQEIKILMQAVMRNIQFFLRKSNSKIVSKALHSRVLAAFDFLKTLDLKDKKIVSKINEAVDKLNNGSHDLFAVEIFARGIRNVPMRFMPIPSPMVLASLGVKRVKTSGVSDIVGFANTSDIAKALLKLVHTTKKGFADLEGNKSKVNREMFNPDKLKPMGYYRTVDWKTQKDVFGKEVKLMGLLVNEQTYNEWWKAYKQWLANKNFVEPKLTYIDKKFLI